MCLSTATLYAKKIAFLVLCCFAFYFVQAQAPAVQWQKMLGGSGAEMGASVQQTADGGYIVTGYTQSNDGDVSVGYGGYDYWVVKLDNFGILQWERSFGTAGAEIAYSVQQTTDGGYILAGYDAAGGTGGPNYWIIKLAASGSTQWQRSLGGSGSEIARCIRQTPDGGYIVAGHTNSSNSGDVGANHGNYDYWVVKLDAGGTVQWQKLLGGAQDELANWVAPTVDNGYIIAGHSLSSNSGDVTATGHGSNDYWMVKLDATGNIQWQRLLGGSGSDQAFSVLQTTDGGYTVAGRSNSTDGDVSNNHGGFDYWVVKLNGLGIIQWQNSFGGSGVEQAACMAPVSDGGSVIAGYSNSTNGDVTGNHGGFDYWLIRLNAAGALQWEKSLGGSVADEAFGIQQTADGGYVVSGFASSNDGDASGNHGTGTSDTWVVKLASDGVLPVTFGTLSAAITDGNLKVAWETLEEQNCSHYNVEGSLDGVVFKKLGTVASAATDGNSSIPLEYDFSTSAGALSFASLVLLPLLFSFGRRRYLLHVKCMAVIVLLFGAIACNKQVGVKPDSTSTLFIRIAQVDKDGKKHYSKTVMAVRK